MTFGRTFVIGDIHGCADELDCLLDALGLVSGDTVVFLGDYIDRGPASRQVVERVRRLPNQGLNGIFLRGNHEDMFLAYLGEPGSYPDAFCANGGEATLASYGLHASRLTPTVDDLPDGHAAFFRSLRSSVRIGDFCCVHAGLDGDRPLSEQRDDDMLWIRERFVYRSHPFPFTVVYGHTPGRDVYLDLPYKIGLDTGLVYGNLLSCLELESKELYQVAWGIRQVRRRNLQAEFDRSRSPAQA